MIKEHASRIAWVYIAGWIIGVTLGISAGPWLWTLVKASVCR